MNCDVDSVQLIINRNENNSWYFTISFYCELVSDSYKLNSGDVHRSVIKELLRGSDNSSNLGDKNLLKELYRELDIDNIIGE